MIIVVSILADLSSIARKIAIEKDWVVEICGRYKDMLASNREREREGGVVKICVRETDIHVYEPVKERNRRDRVTEKERYWYMYWVDGGDKKTCMPERERKEK